MKHIMQSSDIQHEALRIYKALVDERADWGGALVLLSGPGCAETGAPAAVSIAGGTTLAIDSDAAAMKSAMRAGYLDFVVNTLDEALRTLKNEIRQKRPLSVGLISDTNSALSEIVDRGVQPDLQLAPSGDLNSMDPQLDALRERGMLCRSVPGIEQVERHHQHFFAAQDATALRAIDTALLAALPTNDIARRRWLERVPSYLREARSAGRWIWLSDGEIASLAAQALTPRSQP